jgi:hypothetical protein
MSTEEENAPPLVYFTLGGPFGGLKEGGKGAT